jgi:hypothetical protein
MYDKWLNWFSLLGVMQSLGYNIKNWGFSTKKSTLFVKAEDKRIIFHIRVILWASEPKFLNV